MKTENTIASLFSPALTRAGVAMRDALPALLAAALFTTLPALADAADTVGGLMTSTTTQLGSLTNPISAGSYIIGIILFIQGLMGLHRYSQKPGAGDPPLSGIMFRMTGAGLFSLFPSALGIARETMFGSSPDTKFHASWAAAGASGGQGLDYALISMINDIKPGLTYAISAVAFISGIFMTGKGLMGLANYNFQKDDMNKLKIFTSLGVGSALVSMTSSVNTILNSVFGNTTSYAMADALAYDKSSLDAASVAHIDAVMGAIFTWLAMIGLIAMLRGMWVLKQSIEGSKGLTAPLTHLIAGACLVNCGHFIPMVQKTLGVA